MIPSVRIYRKYFGWYCNILYLRVDNCNQIMVIWLPNFVFTLNPINGDICIVDNQVNEHNVAFKTNS
jgi:hypothetical protein